MPNPFRLLSLASLLTAAPVHGATEVRDFSELRCTAYARRGAPKTPKGPRSFRKAQVYFQRGRESLAAASYADAQRWFERALRSDPEHGFAHLGLAEVHLYTDEDRDQMRDHLAKAVTLLPRNPRAHADFARFLTSVRDFGPAFRHYECALALKTTDEEVLVEYGRALAKSGRPRRAAVELSRAVARQPDDPSGHLALAEALEAAGRVDQAAGAVDRAARLIETSAPLFRRAAELYEQAGLDRDARRARRQADRIDPPKTRRHLRPLPKARVRKRAASPPAASN